MKELEGLLRSFGDGDSLLTGELDLEGLLKDLRLCCGDREEDLEEDLELFRCAGLEVFLGLGDRDCVGDGD